MHYVWQHASNCTHCQYEVLNFRLSVKHWWEPLKMYRFSPCLNTVDSTDLWANPELGEKRKEIQGEGVRERNHRAISDEPDACCYADHREGNREGGREKEKVERRGKRMDTSSIWISSLRSGWSTGKWSLWKEENTSRRIREEKKKCIQILKLRTSGASLCLQWQCPFHHIQSVYICVCICSLFELKQILS